MTNLILCNKVSTALLWVTALDKPPTSDLLLFSLINDLLGTLLSCSRCSIISYEVLYWDICRNQSSGLINSEVLPYSSLHVLTRQKRFFSLPINDLILCLKHLQLEENHRCHVRRQTGGCLWVRGGEILLLISPCHISYFLFITQLWKYSWWYITVLTTIDSNRDSWLQSIQINTLLILNYWGYAAFL